MKKKVRLLISFFLLILAVSSIMMTASAAKTDETSVTTGWSKSGSWYTYYSKSGKMLTGWRKINGKVYYFRKKAEEKAPLGSRVTGFYTIGEKTYYFSSKGVLQTGWKKIGKKTYYFAPNGKNGELGKMAVGFQKIEKGYFLFGDDGAVSIGWHTYRGHKYFFSNSTKIGVRGRALTGWKKIGSSKYFFSTYGVMQKNRWISKKYYLGSDGKMLKSCVTPDGYVVNSSGQKVRVAKGWIRQSGDYYYYVSGKKTTGWKTISGKKYYFNSDGVRQTGWQRIDGATYYLKSGVLQTGWKTISGKRYYFDKDGKMAVSTTVDGIEIGADGVALSAANPGESETTEPKTGAKILILSGHGQGDVGATATYGKTTYQEYKYTREFATLIYNELRESSLNVTLYDQNYDLYQVMSGKKKGPIPNLKNYDYVLEIHFNATAVANKDLKGDKQYKGVGMYINSAKKNYTLDKNIVKAIAQTGFKVWGGGAGIFKSSGLFNAKTCQAKGVSYGLLETAFIDDKDDMTFYNANKSKMAKAVAGALINYFK